MCVILDFKSILSIILLIVFLQVKANAINATESGCYDALTYSEVINKCSELIQIEPLNAKAYLRRGEANFELKNYSNSIYDFDITIVLLPNSDDAYMYRAMTKNAIQDYQGVVLDSSFLIEKNPNNSFYYSLRGEAKKNLNDFMGSIQDYTSAIRFNSNDFMLFWARGDAKFRIKDYIGAIEDFTKNINILESAFSDDNGLKKLSTQKMLLIYNKDEFYRLLGTSYVLRGLAEIEIRNTYQGCLDFSKAGELGHSSAYEDIQKFCPH